MTGMATICLPVVSKTGRSRPWLLKAAEIGAHIYPVPVTGYVV